MCDGTCVPVTTSHAKTDTSDIYARGKTGKEPKDKSSKS